MAKTIMNETEESRIYRMRWWTLLVVTFTSVVLFLNATVMTIALPTIQTELGATITQIQWVANIYPLAAGALLLTFGALSDRFGRAKILQAGLVVFFLANLGAALSTSAIQLIISRGFMGVGLAMMQSCILAIITNVFPAQERGKAIGVWAGIQSAGLALGPIIGGGIIQGLSWEWIFIFNICMAVIAFVAGWFLIPESLADRPSRLDLLGNALFLIGIASLIYGLNNAGARGWTDIVVLSTIISSVVVLILFVLWERRAAEPLLDMRFFRRAGFSIGLTTMASFILWFTGFQYLLTFYMQFVKGHTPLQTGERFIPLAIGCLIGATISHRLVTRLGMKRFFSSGFIGGALVILPAAFFEIDTPFSKVGPVLFFMGFFFGCVAATAQTILMGSLPRAKSGIASAMNNIATYAIGAVSVATLGSILSTIYSNRFLKAAESIQGIPAGLLDKASDSVGAAVGVAKSGYVPPDAVDPLVKAAGDGFMDGWQIVAIILCVICAIGAAVYMLIMPDRLDENEESTSQESVS